MGRRARKSPSKEKEHAIKSEILNLNPLVAKYHDIAQVSYAALTQVQYCSLP